VFTFPLLSFVAPQFFMVVLRNNNALFFINIPSAFWILILICFWILFTTATTLTVTVNGQDARSGCASNFMILCPIKYYLGVQDGRGFDFRNAVEYFLFGKPKSSLKIDTKSNVYIKIIMPRTRYTLYNTLVQFECTYLHLGNTLSN